MTVGAKRTYLFTSTFISASEAIQRKESSTVSLEFMWSVASFHTIRTTKRFHRDESFGTQAKERVR